MGRLRIDSLTPPPAPLLGPDGAVLVPRCYRAATPLARLVGLLGTPDLGPDEGLWIAPCASVHTLGLRAHIGCAFLDGEGRVLRVVDPLLAWRAASARGARAALEAPARVLSRVRPGDVLRWQPAPASPGFSR
jgi:uncharacterized protein